MKYYNLMHKNNEVLTFSREDDSFSLLNINDLNLIPIKSINDDKKSIKEKSEEFIKLWLFDRLIPEKRIVKYNLRTYFNCPSSFEMIEKVHGLSLSDQYWIKEVSENIKWDNINFFDNIINDENYLLFINDNVKNINCNFSSSTSSPSINLNGEMSKAWVFSDGKYKLIKGSTKDIRIYNEEIASEILKKLELKHIPYVIGEIDGNKFCVCDNYITKDTEFLSARTILNMYEYDDNNKLNYENFIDLCIKKGLKNVKKDIDNMIIFDYIMGNSDRHLNNYGVVRDANTLELLELFPIFDNGNILWFQNDKEKDEKCRMDENTNKWETILNKIDNFNLLNNSFINEIPKFVVDKYNKYNNIINLDKNRIDDVIVKIEERIKNIKIIAENKKTKGIIINY